MEKINGFEILLAGLNFLFALFIYFYHDRKIKQQSILLNKYNIDKIEREKKEENKAIIEANVFNDTDKCRVIKIYNKGKCIAKNVKVKIPDSEGFCVLHNPCPIDIKPQNAIDIYLGGFTDNHPDLIDIYFEWSDGISNHNIDKQTIQIF